jgi:DNA-binding MarR family transcriptional regulator
MARPKQRKPPKSQGSAIKKPSKRKSRGEIDYEALAQFRYRLRRFLAFSDANARNAGLTSQQYQTLLAIKGFSSQRPMFVGELAELLLIKHHTTVELVDRMAKLRFLQRTVDPNDKRRVFVTLTKRGHSLLEKVAAINFKHLGSSRLALLKISKILGHV